VRSPRPRARRSCARGRSAYVSVDSDLGSQQWRKVDALLRKFPGRDEWLAQLRRELAQQNLDYENDVAPAFGPEVDLAVVPGASGSDYGYAWLTKPESTAKAEALARKLGASSDPRRCATT
jgi:hypothetical protein